MESQPEQVPQPPETTTEQVTKKKSRIGTIIWIIVVLLLIIAGVLAYLWRDTQANTQHADDTATINNLKSDNDKLKKDAAGVKNTAVTPKESAKTTVSEATRANLADAIKSGNTAALAGYMASSVHVIVAASEGIGDRTPAQAINDLNYISTAVSPWNFSLDSATLAKYAAGSYKTYFLTDSLVGKSSDGYVISFNFDTTGKISGIFMAIKDDLLL